MLQKIIGIFMLCVVCLTACKQTPDNIGETTIAKWKDNKKGAISITYDDATINQFHQALPIMDTLGFKGTFFINTTDIPGSQFLPKRFGRSLKEIILESASTPTDTSNLFERASALRFMKVDNAVERHNSAGSLYESGKVAEALKVVDDAFAEARKKKAFQEVRPVLLTGELITWPEIKAYAKNGHEFGNHTISHPRLSVLDEDNLLYELEKCKEEILNQLGPKHTFSAECPFGTENERVMQYAYKIHPALRNRMPEPFLEELNRASKKNPSPYNKEYVQWQRGPLQKTTVEQMKAWVDTLLVHDNIWLVLTFHGVDGIGWEAIPHEKHKAYFSYMKENEKDLWVGTFGDVTKYMRERMSAKIDVDKSNEDKIIVNINHALDTTLYNFPLTLTTMLGNDWKKVTVKQGNTSAVKDVLSNEKGNAVRYQAIPNHGPIEIAQAE
jgi:peptidoglycan/xylan/chitin deacetylase (PgdA/CDA1 family)